MLPVHEVAVGEERRVEGGADHRVARRVQGAQGARERARLVRQGLEQRREGGPVEVEGAERVAEQVVADFPERIEPSDVATEQRDVDLRQVREALPDLLQVRALLGAPLLQKLADLPAEAEARTRSIEDLKRENAQLRRDLTAAKKASPAPVAPPAPKVIERPVVKDAQLSRLEKLVGHLGAIAISASEASCAIANQVRPLVEDRKIKFSARVTDNATPVIRRIQHSIDTVLRANATPAGDAPKRSAPQQRILDSLAWLEACGLAPADRTQLALLADQSPNSSAYANNLGKLRTSGFIDYPLPGRVGLTDTGRAMASAEASEIPATAEELQESLYRKLSAPQARILRQLVERYPDAVERVDLASRADQSPGSSAYANNLGRLRSLGLIDYPTPGHAVACPVLFLEAR